MTDTKAHIDALLRLSVEARKTLADMDKGLVALSAVLDAQKAAPPIPEPAPASPARKLTARTIIEIVEHEAIVLEAYLDSSKVWTWGVGVTNASGHQVYPRYKDKPQTVQRCLEVYIWLLENAYLPPVLQAFKGFHLSENQLAAALSFHWNTGAIQSTEWVKLLHKGKEAEARKFLETHYLNGGVLTSRRAAEAELFFDGKWTGDGTVTVWPVRKPSYTPNWGKPTQMNIASAVQKIMAG